MSVCGLVGFESFEAGLRILQDACALVEHDRAVCAERAFVPSAVFIIGYIAPVGLDIPKSQVCPVDIFLFHTVLTLLFCVTPCGYRKMAYPGWDLNYNRFTEL